MIDGRVPVGFGAAKGFGEVELDEKTLSLTLGYAYPDAAPLDGLPADEDRFFLEAASTDWEDINQTGWLEAWNSKLDSYKVTVPHTQSRDPYWSASVRQLYRKETTIYDLLK